MDPKPPGKPLTTVVNVLTRAAREFSERPALSVGAVRRTYGEAAARVDGLASALRETAAPGDRIAILAPNSVLFWESSFAVAAAGMTLVPLNTRLTPEGIHRLFDHADVRGWIVHRRFAALAGRVVRRRVDEGHTLWTLWGGREEEPEIGLGAGAREIDDLPLPPSRSALSEIGEEIDPDSPAQIYFTSGTTGEPKGVILTHRNIVTHAQMAADALELDGDDCWGHIAPMFHLADAWATFAMTLRGGVHRLVDRYEPQRVLQELFGGITVTNLVPTMLSDLVKPSLPRPDDDRCLLRTILSGGAPIAPALVGEILDRFPADYVQTYGLTETSPFLTMSLLPPHIAALPREERLVYQAKTGRPLPGVEVRVVRDDGNDVAADETEVGEIVARGPTVTPGYWENSSATEAAFRDGWFHTGDLATVDDEGFVLIVDRKKDVILSGGETVYSTEVEAVLYSHPAVHQAAAAGIPHARWGEAVVAFVVLHDREHYDAGRDLEPEEIAREIRHHCSEQLGPHQIPKEIVFLDELPRTGSGKLAKRALRDEYEGLFSSRREESSDS